MYHFDSICGPALRNAELIIPEAQSPLRGDEMSEVDEASGFFSGIHSGNGNEPSSSQKLTATAEGVTAADAKEASAIWAQRKQLQNEAGEHDAQVRALTGQIASRRTELTAARQAQHDVVAVRSVQLFGFLLCVPHHCSRQKCAKLFCLFRLLFVCVQTWYPSCGKRSFPSKAATLVRICRIPGGSFPTKVCRFGKQCPITRGWGFAIEKEEIQEGKAFALESNFVHEFPAHFLRGSLTHALSS